MQDSKQEIIAILKKANNVLVTVKKDPSVDELSAALGLTLALNKLGKHAAAVYSGQTPSTIEFLQPEDTFEKTTDSLRDFIISLDKAKADKLKYKVEDDVVKIFITPYRSSISEADLEFSQGDFNVEAVVALGVKEQLDLDEAIRAHGRIFHDAKVITINNSEGADLGGISWVDVAASGMSELTADVARELGDNVLDEQVATAFLTGIVASTDRFSNERTSANTMKTSAVLMAAGANQQLVATKLTVAPVAVDLPDETSEQAASPDTDVDAVPDVDIAADGSLKITHQGASEPDHEDGAHKEPQPEPPTQPAEEPAHPEQTPAEATSDEAELRLPPAMDSNEPDSSPIERSFVGTPGGEDAHLRQGAGESATSSLDYEAAPSEPVPADTPMSSLPPSTPESSRKVIQPLDKDTGSKQPNEALPAVPSTLEDIERAVHSNHLTAQNADLRPGENTEEHSELDLSMLQTPMGLASEQGTPLPPPTNPGAAPPVPPPIIPPTL
jgi:hypothetical protein